MKASRSKNPSSTCGMLLRRRRTSYLCDDRQVEVWRHRIVIERFDQQQTGVLRTDQLKVGLKGRSHHTVSLGARLTSYGDEPLRK